MDSASYLRSYSASPGNVGIPATWSGMQSRADNLNSDQASLLSHTETLSSVITDIGGVPGRAITRVGSLAIRGVAAVTLRLRLQSIERELQKGSSLTASGVVAIFEELFEYQRIDRYSDTIRRRARGLLIRILEPEFWDDYVSQISLESFSWSSADLDLFLWRLAGLSSENRLSGNLNYGGSSPSRLTSISEDPDDLERHITRALCDTHSAILKKNPGLLHEMFDKNQLLGLHIGTDFVAIFHAYQRIDRYSDSGRLRYRGLLLHILEHWHDYSPQISQELLARSSADLALFLRRLAGLKSESWLSNNHDGGPSEVVDDILKSHVTRALCNVISAILKVDPGLIHDVFDIHQLLGLLASTDLDSPSSGAALDIAIKGRREVVFDSFIRLCSASQHWNVILYILDKFLDSSHTPDEFMLIVNHIMNILHDALADWGRGRDGGTLSGSAVAQSSVAKSRLMDTISFLRFTLQWCSTNRTAAAAFVNAEIGTLIVPFVGVAPSCEMSQTTYHVSRLLSSHRCYGIELPSEWQYRDINLVEGRGNDVLSEINASILNSAPEDSSPRIADLDTEENDWSTWLTIGDWRFMETATYTPFYYDDSTETLGISFHSDFDFSHSLDILRHRRPQIPKRVNKVEIVADTYPHQQIAPSLVADLIGSILPQVSYIEFVGVEFASNYSGPRWPVWGVILTDVTPTLEGLVHVLGLLQPKHLSLSSLFVDPINVDEPDPPFISRDVNIPFLTLGKAISPPVIISLTRILASQCLKSLEVTLAPYEDMISATASLLSTSMRSIRKIDLKLVPLQFIADHSTEEPVPLNLSPFTSLRTLSFELQLGYSLAFSYIIDVLALAPAQLRDLTISLEFGLPLAEGGSGRSDSKEALSVLAEDCTRMEKLILRQFSGLNWLKFDLSRGGEQSATLEAVRSVIEDNMLELRQLGVLDVYPPVSLHLPSA